MLISILTGFAAGALHVISGADHLVSIAPSSIRLPRAALKSGLAWGIGHSMGVLVISTVAILLKDLAQIERMSSFAEFMVGITLLVVGILAIKQSLGLNIHTHKHHHKNGSAHEHMHLHFRGKRKHGRHTHAATGLGILQGLAGASHVLAVIPALALPPIGAVAYLTAYLFGSIVAMSSVVLIISIASLSFGQKSLPIIIGSTGLLSILTGLLWLQRNTI